MFAGAGGSADFAVAAKGRFREGFRMPAWRERSTRRGRRPKASEEGTRGKLVSSWPAMGIWVGSGVAGGWFA